MNDFVSKSKNIEENYPLAKLTWFNVGGISKYFFQPDNIEKLEKFLKINKSNLDIYPLGAGSNVLVRDKGYNGIIIHFSRLNKIEIDDKGIITAEAGALDAQVSRFARDHCRTNLEFLIGIPGSIGGGIRMNSGAYGSDFKKILIDVKAINKEGNVKIFKNKELGLSYRNCKIADEWYFLNARLKTKPGKKEEIQNKMKGIIINRKKSQPTGVKTGGSTFMNNNTFKAWEEIDKSGCRGMVFGGAMISEKHCNFIINKKNATATEIESLGEKVKQKVFLKTGNKLNWEIKIIGVK